MVNGAVKTPTRGGTRARVPPRTARTAALTIATLLAIAAIAAAAAASPARADFGIAQLTTVSSTSQAGAHPNVTASFGLTTDALGNPTGQVRRETLDLPPGLLGDPETGERCGQAEFQELRCPTDAQVGVLEASLVVCQGISASLQADTTAGSEIVTVANTNGLCASEAHNTIKIGAETAQIAYVLSETTVALERPLAEDHQAGEVLTQLAQSVPAPIPLYDLQPTPGHAATFGVSVLVASILVQVDLSPDGSLRATIEEISTLLPMTGAALTLWGVPADQEHDQQRCNQLESNCGVPFGGAPQPFMTNPTDCDGPLETVIALESWQGQTARGTATMPPITGCEALQLSTALKVTPASTERDTPSGYSIALTVPQDEEPYGLATPAFNNVEVELPEGTSLSPGAAEGLQPCTEAQFEARNCPGASMVGTVAIQTPLLPETLDGGLYIGTQTATAKYRVLSYVKAADTTIALSGQLEADQSTGRLTAIFEDLPQLPIGGLELDLFGGPTAPLANPERCGPANSVARIATYAGHSAETTSAFTVDGNGAGGPCPASTPFEPTLIAGATEPLAATFTPFTFEISRDDGEQAIAGFEVTLPNGLASLLKGVVPCPEPNAINGTCQAGSQLGTATIEAGAGPQPLRRTGSIYLTGPYRGAPFGLAVVVNASTDAIRLGTVTLRARVLINPETLGLTIASDPVPQILAGIPLRLRSVDINLDRRDLLFEPSSCARQRIQAKIAGGDGAFATPAVPFAIAGCAGLRFAPKLNASTKANASERGQGASLNIQIANPAGPSAAIRSAIVELPAALRPRLSAIQGACLSHGGPLRPSACPASSVIGTATVTTPMLPSPLTGPLYLVAHGGRTLPSLVALLAGYGLSAELTGAFAVSRTGSISAAFRSLPDVPVDALQIDLSPGPSSLLGAIASPCARALRLPYQLTAHNGAQIDATARIAVNGCPRRARRHHHRPSGQSRPEPAGLTLSDSSGYSHQVAASPPAVRRPHASRGHPCGWAGLPSPAQPHAQPPNATGLYSRVVGSCSIKPTVFKVLT